MLFLTATYSNVLHTTQLDSTGDRTSQYIPKSESADAERPRRQNVLRTRRLPHPNMPSGPARELSRRGRGGRREEAPRRGDSPPRSSAQHARAAAAAPLGRLLREVAAEEEALEVDVLLRPRLARHRLLRHEAGGGEHAEAAVRELLLLHLAELG